jgi:glycosyltransferase involved in cell wall biosynthesis
MYSSKKLNIIIFANSITKGDALSGADRIFIECSRVWLKNNANVSIITCPEGYKMCKRYELDAKYIVFSDFIFFPIYILYLARTIKGIYYVLKLKENSSHTIVYSSSDFWPDSIPSLFFKIKNKKSKWVAGYYLFVTNPFDKNSPYKGKNMFKGFIYNLSQIPIFKLIKKYSDLIFVTNDLDRYHFIDKKISSSQVIAIKGGVDLDLPNQTPEPKEKKFDAVFIGRLHPQKGVIELIDIWNYVCTKKRDAKLAIIGVGELENDVRQKVSKYNLNKNVVFYGFKDGIEKNVIFKNSKLVVHTSIYDSGGMAACEAMACGLPGVSFDLPALKMYYPKGMIKIKCFDLIKFGDAILSLLSDENLYQRIKADAVDLSLEWGWENRAKKILNVLNNLFNNNPI